MERFQQEIDGVLIEFVREPRLIEPATEWSGGYLHRYDCVKVDEFRHYIGRHAINELTSDIALDYAAQGLVKLHFYPREDIKVSRITPNVWGLPVPERKVISWDSPVYLSQDDCAAIARGESVRVRHIWGSVRASVMAKHGGMFAGMDDEHEAHFALRVWQLEDDAPDIVIDLNRCRIYREYLHAIADDQNAIARLSVKSVESALAIRNRDS